MLRPRPFQGAAARGRGRSGGVHVVHEKDRRGCLRAATDGERPPNVFLAGGKRQSRLGADLPDPSQECRLAGPIRMTGKGSGDQRGEVVSPAEIFPGPDRDGDDGGPVPGRKPVGPFPADRFEETSRERLRRIASSAVFRGMDAFAGISPVEEKGQDEIARPGPPRTRERALCEAAFLPEDGPSGRRPGGKIGNRGGEERPQQECFPGKGTEPFRNGYAEAPREISERMPGWSAPAVRA